MAPTLSPYFENLVASPIREAQLEFARRPDAPLAVDVSVGNIRLPMHPAMRARMNALGAPSSPFGDGAVPYTPTPGLPEAREAVRHLLAASGLPTESLFIQMTQGGSQAIELAILATCGEAGTSASPLCVIDPSYANYRSIAARLGRGVVAMRRDLRADGEFQLPALDELDRFLRAYRPGALLITPYDNPTGQVLAQEDLTALARLCVQHDIWLLSDETYRELHFDEREAHSIWSITDADAPGIAGRRVSIESASKVWNACGLRVGALVTDNLALHDRAVWEAASNLCPSAVGQHVFAALLHESAESLHAWYRAQRAHYGDHMAALTQGLRDRLPGALVSRPDGAIYAVVDLRDLVPPHFDAREFSLYCARHGEVELGGRRYTLLVAPMSGFYGSEHRRVARTQIRLALVEGEETLPLVPPLLNALLGRYLAWPAQSPTRGSTLRRGGPTL